MKTTITNTIKILLAVALVIAAQQYNLAMRHQVDDVAFDSGYGTEAIQTGKYFGCIHFEQK